MKRTDKRIMRDALINIMKGAICWDNKRMCWDAAEVAARALRKVNPKLCKLVDALPYKDVKVFKNGAVRFKGDR